MIRTTPTSNYFERISLVHQKMITLGELSKLEKSRFVSVLGGIYEHSSWVVERLNSQEFESLTKLAAGLRSIVDSASRDEKLALLRAHPDLACRAKVLTNESQSEQKGAGLDCLTESELAKFTELNETYKSKFGWPFILAVKNATKRTILGAFEARVLNDSSTEFDECMNQVHKIAWMRLGGAVRAAPTGFLTVHVLDTANGTPAAGMYVTLTLPDGSTREFVTNDDGRLPDGPAVKGAEFATGFYEWQFYVGDYFCAKSTKTAATPFLSVVPIRFGVDNCEDHYHVPLLCSPWTFSTYRGS